MIKKTIWFDFDNSPHVPILLPLAKEFEKRGYEIIYTARDVSQTYELLEMANVEFKRFGKVFPKSSLWKLLFTIYWGLVLALKLKKKNIACAVNHSSRRAIIASWLMRIPSVVLYDYEYVNSFFQNNLAGLVLMPEVVGEQGALNAGISLKNLDFYPGIKEQLYLTDSNGFKRMAGLPDNKVILTMRLPGEGHYTMEESEVLFDGILDKLLSDSNVYLILLPRSSAQKENILARLNGHIEAKRAFVPEKSLPAKELILSSDLVIGSGGTMVREAAVYGVPAYTFFQGPQGAIDKYLESLGRLTFINKSEDIEKIKIQKKQNSELLKCSTKQVDWICNRIEKEIKI